VGGLVGGVLGRFLLLNVLTNRQRKQSHYGMPSLSDGNNSKGKRRQLKHLTRGSIEAARRSLEDKIAKLNETIDEVRLTLGDVNRNQLGGTRAIAH